MIVFVSEFEVEYKQVNVIGQLPPSAKLVYKVLESGDPLTQKEIIERTRLPSRTVRYAIQRLKTERVLKERMSFVDARQSLYSISSSGGVPMVA